MAMNLREGTRRLALLLGIVGATFAGFLSYTQLQSTLRERADHIRFEQLSNSSVVEQARKDCLNKDAPSEHGPWEKYQKPPEKLPPLPKGAELIPPYCYIPDDDPNASYYTLSESNTDGIKTVHFENRGIASIETQDGNTSSPAQAPPVRSYIVIAFLPLLGFLLPWCAIRAIGWVTSGFVQPAK